MQEEETKAERRVFGDEGRENVIVGRSQACLSFH